MLEDLSQHSLAMPVYFNIHLEAKIRFIFRVLFELSEQMQCLKDTLIYCCLITVLTRRLIFLFFFLFSTHLCN